MYQRAELTDCEPYSITQYDVHAFDIAHDTIRSLDLSSIHLTNIIRSILGDNDVWPHELSILCSCWLKECGEIHFQQNIIKPIQKSLSSYFKHNNISSDDNIIRDISYMVSLFVGQCGFHPQCSLNEEKKDNENNLWEGEVIFCYDSRMVESNITIRRWDTPIALIRGDENILYGGNEHGLWRASIYVKTVHEYCHCYIGLTHDKDIHNKTIPRYFINIPESMSSCVAYISYPSHRFLRQKEAFLRHKLTNQYNAMKDENKLKKKKKGILNALEQSLGMKQFQMKENVKFNYNEYLSSDFRNGEDKIYGKILIFNREKQRYHIRVENDEFDECNQVVSQFRKNISKDYPVWNQHRAVETFEDGDVIGIEVNINEKWCRFYRNGVMQYHVNELPINTQQENGDDNKGLWLFMSMDRNCCYIIDRKV